MPIRPELRHFYGRAWREEIRPRILARARNRCEQCGKPNGADIFTYTWSVRPLRFASPRAHYMIWLRIGTRTWRDQAGRRIPDKVWLATLRGSLPRRIRVQLGVAHADGDPANMNEENLRAWCTWCHLHHDQPQHKQSRATRKDSARPLLTTEG